MKRASTTAVHEVTSKSDKAIERSTSKAWAARAVACFEKYAETGDLKWFERACTYRDEAIEHAALVRDFGRTVGTLQRQLDKAEKKTRRG